MSSLLTLVSVHGLLDSALKSAAVVLLAAVVAAVLGRASAAWRHLVWCLSVVSTRPMCGDRAIRAFAKCLQFPCAVVSAGGRVRKPLKPMRADNMRPKTARRC